MELLVCLRPILISVDVGCTLLGEIGPGVSESGPPSNLIENPCLVPFEMTQVSVRRISLHHGAEPIFQACQ